MQSQQKKVKWSRGETADALEERTDTGITNVSVSRLENCTCDIYGNVSRRPALKLFDTASPRSDTSSPTDPLYPFVFKKSHDNYYIFVGGRGITWTNTTSIPGWHIINRAPLNVPISVDTSGVTITAATDAKVTTAQQNNYMLCFNLIGPACVLQETGENAFSLKTFTFRGPWYAPGGTNTRTVNNTTVPSLNFNADGQGFTQYTYTINNQSYIYYAMDTGLQRSSLNAIKAQIPIGSIVGFPKLGAHMRVEGYDASTTKLYIFGSLLTPVINNTNKDTSVSVEYGYVEISSSNGFYPTVGTFVNQRLYISGFVKVEGNTATPICPGLIIASQIGRYDDFKNDYNAANEPLILDLDTNTQEYIQHLVPYNGLKIFTDNGEYSYSTTLNPQSKYGSSKLCSPLLFNSLLLYLDSNLRTIRGLQYELKQDIYASSSISDLCPRNLIFNPTGLVKSYEKEYVLGNFLYCPQPLNPGNLIAEPKTTCSIAVCNFTPSTQNMIWGRWNMPKANYGAAAPSESVRGMIEVNNIVYLIVQTLGINTVGAPTSWPYLQLGILDYEGRADFQVAAGSRYNLYRALGSGYTTIPNAIVSVFIDDIWQEDIQLNAKGEYPKELPANATVGIKINSYIDSHPIDIGGKTKSVVKRIAKAQMSVHDTEAGAITINNKTGYMNPAKDMINFYGVTGMKREIKYSITNVHGAMFHLESLLLNLEYGTLIS